MGASGMVMDQIVYRQMGGKTVVSAKPAKSSNPPSEAQLNHRALFNRASAYGKMAMRNPLLNEIYAAQANSMNSTYTMALKDYMHAPVIEAFILKDFVGKAGDRIGLYASDNFGIATVEMTILDHEGKALERGDCTEVVKNGVYEYVVQADLPEGGVYSLRAEARDLAGNVTELQKEVGL